MRRGFCLEGVINEARWRGLLLPDHFTVESTLFEARDSHKRYERRDEEGPRGGGHNRSSDLEIERRRRETHESTADSDERLYRNRPQHVARLCCSGRLLNGKRHYLNAGVELTEAG